MSPNAPREFSAPRTQTTPAGGCAAASTREINEDVYVDLDAHGKVLSMTIEHAHRNGRLPEVSVQQFDKPAVSAKGHR